nr:MAG TPA: hypothetical protein [Caudoviricetes sp.]
MWIIFSIILPNFVYLFHILLYNFTCNYLIFSLIHKKE